MPTIANGSVAPPTVANHMISSPDGWPTSARELPMRFKAPSLSASPTYGWSRLLGAVVVSFFFVWSALSGKVSARLVILCWMLASITMNVINKEVAIRFEAPSFALFLQMVFAVAMFSVVEWRNLTCGKLSDLLKWSVVPFFFAGMLFTSIKSLKELSLSGVLILRNILPLLTFCVEKLLYDSPAHVTSSMVLSMVTALVGTIMFGVWNVAVTHNGMLFIVANCGLTAVDRILQRHFLQDPNFSVSLPLCMVWNNLIGAILICVFAYGNGEFFLWAKLANDASSMAWTIVCVACFGGCSLGYLGLKCQKLVSATSFLMLQNLSKVFLILVGTAYYGDHMWGISALGCALSMSGAMWYGHERLPAETAATCVEGNNEKMDPEKLRILKVRDLKQARRALP